MKRPPPPLNQIRSFECAARHLSFTRAAEELGYTQAAVSTHIRGLEKYVGRPLFIRHARSLELTEIGEAFLPTLRQALAQIDTATDAIVTSSRDQSVILACPISLAENWVPGVLAGFRAQHPEIEVLVHGTIWNLAADEIADVVISIHRADEVPEGHGWLWDEELLLLADPETAAEMTRPEDLLDRPKIVLSGRQEYWRIMGHALGLPRFEIEPVLKTNSSNVSLEFAARGLGVSVSLYSLSEIYMRRGLLAEPFGLRPQSPWSYYISARHGRKTGAARELFDHIRSAARTMPGITG